MAGQQRVYKQKISSAQGMQKIFKAMEMISAARISRAQSRVAATTPYSRAITRAVAAVAAHSEDAEHPYLTERRSSGRSAILVVTSDRGMAGSYSASALREAENLVARLTEEGRTPVLYVVGRKGVSYFSFREREVERSWTPYSEGELVELGREISATVQEGLTSPDPAVHLDEFYVVYTRFESRFTQTPRVARLVPLEIVEGVTQIEDRTAYPLYDFRPGPREVLDALLPRYVDSRIINFLIQSIASEHAARQKAMSTASDNADTQIKKFTRLANAARQAEITQEITEIVGGADALSSSR